MLDELTYAKEMLRRGGYTLFLCSEGHVTFSEERGIVPLLALTETDGRAPVPPTKLSARQRQCCMCCWVCRRCMPR